MSDYRGPRFGFLHAMRETGVGGLSSAFAVQAGHPLDYLADASGAKTFRQATSESFHTISLDRGPNFASLRSIDRIWFAPGNNNTGTFNVFENSVAGFPGSNPLLSNSPFNATLGGPTQAEFGTASTKRFIGIAWQGTDQWINAEIVLSETRTMNGGVTLDGLPDLRRQEVDQINYATGDVVVVVKGGERREFSITWENVLEPDIALLRELLSTVGVSEPFLIDRVSFAADPDADEPVRWVKLRGNVEERGNTINALDGPQIRSFTLELEDHKG